MSDIQPERRSLYATCQDSVAERRATREVGLVKAVGLAKAIPPQSLIRPRGLPPRVALSEAYSIAPGTWAVALAALPNLKLI